MRPGFSQKNRLMVSLDSDGAEQAAMIRPMLMIVFPQRGILVLVVTKVSLFILERHSWPGVGGDPVFCGLW